ncbi:MAG: transcriptional regulator [Clostridia bacterium]|nr:transcriptional regulator [Clostridia bacterium]
MYNPKDIRGGSRGGEGRFTEHFDGVPEHMPRTGYRHDIDAPNPMPYSFGGRDEGPRCMPRGHGRHGMVSNPDFAPEDFADYDEIPHCMPRRHGMPGGPGGNGFGPGGHGRPGNPGDMPPRRPDPEFLKRRIEDSDLMELIDMAGRMAQRRPQSGPARSQSLVLSILAGREALTQRELQQMLGIQPGSLSELVSKLEGKGYLVREKAKDRRGNLLRITDEGRKAIPSADELPVDNSFAALTDDEQDQLALLLRKLLSNWVDAMEAAGPRERRTPFPHHNRPVEL